MVRNVVVLVPRKRVGGSILITIALLILTFTANTQIPVFAHTGMSSGQVKISEFPLPQNSGSPFEITAGPDGNLWFSAVSGAIGKITTKGKFTMFVVPTSGSEPECITPGLEGNLWFTELTGYRVGKITAQGKFTAFTVFTVFTAFTAFTVFTL